MEFVVTEGAGSVGSNLTCALRETGSAGGIVVPDGPPTCGTGTAPQARESLRTAAAGEAGGAACTR